MTTATKGKAYLITPPDRAPALVTATEQDKVQAALDYRFGLTPDRLTRACEAFSPTRAELLGYRHRDAVRLLAEWGPTGQGTELFRFIDMLCPPTTRAAEAQDTTNLATTLGNTLNRVQLAAYGEADFGERSISRAGFARDFRPQRVVGLAAHPADLPVVDPEVADYAELATLTEREITFTVGQNGVILTISRKAVLNDDVQAISRMVSELGRAARRTVARRVWNLWATNATYSPDGVAWFHANHSNLQTAALSEAEVIAAVRKLIDQTQPGNGEKLGLPLRPGSVWLVVPTALWDVAFDVNQTQGSALYHLFGERNEQIIVNPLLTDATDWGAHWDAGQVPSVVVHYLQGREEPELFLADTPHAGQLFTGDKLQYKQRFEFQAALAEFRGAVKAVVA